MWRLPWFGFYGQSHHQTRGRGRFGGARVKHSTQWYANVLAQLPNTSTSTTSTTTAPTTATATSTASAPTISSASAVGSDAVSDIKDIVNEKVAETKAMPKWRAARSDRDGMPTNEVGRSIYGKLFVGGPKWSPRVVRVVGWTPTSAVVEDVPTRIYKHDGGVFSMVDADWLRTHPLPKPTKRARYQYREYTMKIQRPSRDKRRNRSGQPFEFHINHKIFPFWETNESDQHPHSDGDTDEEDG